MKIFCYDKKNFTKEFGIPNFGQFSRCFQKSPTWKQKNLLYISMSFLNNKWRFFVTLETNVSKNLHFVSKNLQMFPKISAYGVKKETMFPKISTIIQCKWRQKTISKLFRNKMYRYIIK